MTHTRAPSVPRPRPAVELRDISVTYGNNGIRPALSGVTIQLFQGDFLVVLGPNGSGKTTLLNVLAGSLSGEIAGEIVWWGRERSRSAESGRNALARVYQDPALGSCAHLTLREHCELTRLGRARSPVSWERMEEALGTVGTLLEPHKQVRTLSGGQRQLFTLLLGVLSEPTVLLLDEPTASLDRRFRALVMEAVRRFAAEPDRLSVMITHDLDEALAHGNRLLVLDDHGQVAANVQAEDRARVTREDLLKWLMISSAPLSALPD